MMASLNMPRSNPINIKKKAEDYSSLYDDIIDENYIFNSVPIDLRTTSNAKTNLFIFNKAKSNSGNEKNLQFDLENQDCCYSLDSTNQQSRAASSLIQNNVSGQLHEHSNTKDSNDMYFDFIDEFEIKVS